jgi:hypothetical protein
MKKDAEIKPEHGYWDEQPNAYLQEMQRFHKGFWESRGFPQPSCGNYYVPVLKIEREDYIYRLEQSPRGVLVTVTVTDPHDKRIADLSIDFIDFPKLTVHSSNTTGKDLEGIIKFLGGDPKMAIIKAPQTSHQI